MASTLIPQSTHRVSWQTAMLLAMVGGIDSYHSRAAFGQSFNEAQITLNEEERSALHLIHKGLHRLFPFDPTRDQEHQIAPRHAL